MPQRLISLDQAASHIGVTTRSVRNYIGQGYFPGYKVPGLRGIMVDRDEVDAALARLPARKILPAYGSYGPKAQIIRLAPQPVVVPPSAS